MSAIITDGYPARNAPLNIALPLLLILLVTLNAVKSEFLKNCDTGHSLFDIGRELLAAKIFHIYASRWEFTGNTFSVTLQSVESHKSDLKFTSNVKEGKMDCIKLGFYLLFFGVWLH